jgi:hypothetical protein
MFGLYKQIDRFETLLCQISRKLDAITALLQLLVDQEHEPGDSYTVTIGEAQQGWWEGQAADHD